MAKFEFKDREPTIIKKQHVNIFNRYFYPIITAINFILLCLITYKVCYV